MTRVGLTLAVATTVACTPFTGLRRDAPEVAVSTDAPSSEQPATAVDAAVDATVDERRTADGTAPDDAAAITDEPAVDTIIPDAGSPCGPFYGECDPLADTGCAEGMRCVITRLARPTLVGCRPPGAVGIASPCTAADACARGLQCLNGSCFRPCCVRAGDGPCQRVGDRTIASSCGVYTGDGLVLGCTIPGQCDHRAQTGCGAGQQCLPTTTIGEAACMPVGSVPYMGACRMPAECVAGHTCAFPGASPEGRCQRTCNPLAAVTGCEAFSVCRRFNDRPLDFGSCSL